jgi:glycosyltransferase involved in cell wall biosynthesis
MRPRVLVSAFACNPEMGSEPGIGHKFVVELAKFCDLTVITEGIQNRAAIERLQKSDPSYAAVDFRYIPWPKVDKQGNRLAELSFLEYYAVYNKWQKRALAMAREILSERRYDLVHHLTMMGYREPGYLWQMPLPFVWGPTGGHVQMPWRYFGILGLRGMLYYGRRNILNWIQMRTHRRVHKAALAARTLITNTSLEARAFERLHGVRPIVIGEFGTEASDMPPKRRDLSRPLEVCWSGRHVPGKGLPMLIYAMARLPKDLPYCVHILGAGAQTPRAKKLALDMGVNDKCVWHGRLPRNEAVAVMEGCDVFALTSLQDGCSVVLIEAINAGLPVICHNCCGFPDAVNDSCAAMFDLRSPRRSAEAFASAITKLCQDAPFYDRLASNMRKRALDPASAKR